MNKTMSAMLSVLLLAVGGVASAAVVYDNGGPNQVNGNEMTAWIQADDFKLPVDTLITDVHFWTIESANGFSGSMEYAIYSDNAGSPGAILAGFSAGTTLVRGSTGRTANFGSEWEYSFDIAPFLASGNVTYWLGLHNGPLTNVTRAEFYWETTDTNSTATGRELPLFESGGWSNNGQEHAFKLTGEVCDDQRICQTVPEPATIALLGLALAGLGIARRRRLG